MAKLVPRSDPAPIWGWLLRQRGRAGLSAALSRTLIAATEGILSPQLTPRELRACCRTVTGHFARLALAERSELCGHLALLETLVPLLARSGRRFHTLDRAARRRCLQACERSRWPPLAHGHARLRHLVTSAYLDTAEAWPNLLPAAAAQ